MKFALAFILFCPALLFAEEAVPNPLLDLAQYQKIAREIEPIRQKRLLSVAQFKAMSAEPGSVVIDTRAAEKFALRHIRGAVSVPCTAFSADTLAKAIPAKDSRVLVYGDTNFRGTPVPGLGTAIRPYTTVFFALATYGYQNVYELGPILDPTKNGLTFEGSGVMVQLDTSSAAEKPAIIADQGIVGVWKLSNHEYVDGTHKEWIVASMRAPAWQWEFTATDLIFDGQQKSSYRLNPQAGTIDLRMFPAQLEKVSQGIYKLENGKLVICLGQAGEKERPANYSPASPAAVRFEFVRAEPLPAADKAILGVWELSNDEAVSGGEWHEMARWAPRWQWEFTATELIFDPGRRRREQKSSYRLDTAQAGAIDLRLDPEKPDEISLGIYKLEGGKLIVCVAKAGKEERPTDFSPASPAARRYEFVRAEPVPAAIKALLGVWKLSNDEQVKGKEWRPVAMRSPAVEWEFTNYQQLIVDPQNPKTSTSKGYRLDPAGRGTIDVQLQLKVGLGIYKLEGDKLIICLGKEGGSERPADFSPASPGERRLEFVRQPVP